MPWIGCIVCGATMRSGGLRFSGMCKLRVERSCLIRDSVIEYHENDSEI